ncbi:MAG TPA: hypothetical protein VK614_06635 [Allosphingosinicella sp.]|nr:hypothetical protein [Allosphingosinicella sp.]
MRVMRTKELLALATVIVSGLAPVPAGAQVSTWSVTGAGCVPTGQTISGIGTFNSAGDAKFPGTSVGEIILTCPVPSSLRSATHLAVTYRDSDGAGNVVLLHAALRRKRLDVGGAQDVPGAVFDSNSFPVAIANVRRSVQFANACNGNPFVFDHDRFTYYVQVNMIRRRPNAEVLLSSVDLTGTSFC